MSGLNDMRSVFASLPVAAPGATAPPSSPEPQPRPDPRSVEPPPLVPKRRVDYWGRFEVHDAVPSSDPSPRKWHNDHPSPRKWHNDHPSPVEWTEDDDAAYLASILDGKHATSDYVMHQIVTGVLSTAFEPLIEKQEVRRMLFGGPTSVA